MTWLDKFLTKQAALKQQALDKLPADELNGIIPGQNDAPGSVPAPGAVPPPPADPSAAPPGGADPNAPPGAMPPGMDPNAPPMDPAMMDAMMAPPEKPKVHNNRFMVDANGIQFEVELTPSLVTEPDMPPGAGLPPQDPMQDTSTNPNASPDALEQWLAEKDKPEGHSDKGTVDPLSQQEEGDGSVDVHDIDDPTKKSDPLKRKQSSIPGAVQANQQGKFEKKADSGVMSPPVTPGADMSAPYYPCAVCANYIAAKNDCKQGLDVEKVQAAKSCSWLNSNFKPFNADSPVRDQTIPQNTGPLSNSDPNSVPLNQGGGSGKAASLNNIWKK